MLRVSPRISSFFRDQQNVALFRQFAMNCRILKRHIDKLLKFETNNKNKTIGLITKFVASKPYLIQTMVNLQFTIIQ